VVVVLNFNKYSNWQFIISNIVQVGLVLLQGYAPKKNTAQIEHNIPNYNSVFPVG
jgi:hypothetical protein